MTSIGQEAFYNCCSLKSISLSDSLTGIGAYTFCYCGSLTSITIPDSVTCIEFDAFSGCGSLDRVLFTLTDPSTYVDFVGDIFSNSNPTVYCHRDTAVDVWASGNYYNVVYLDGIDIDSIRTITLPDSFRLAYGESRTITAYQFPDDHSPVTWSSSDPAVVSVDSGTGLVRGVSAGTATVTASTAAGITASVELRVLPDLNTLSSPDFPDELTEIGDEAFENTSFQAVFIPDTVTDIGSRAFANCRNLLYVYIPESVTYIEDDAFDNCPNAFIDRAD